MTLAQFVVILAVALTTIAVALIVAAVIIAGKQMETEPKRKATQEEIDQFLESYKCCTRVINWIPVEEQKPGAYHVLVTLQHAPDDLEVCEMDYWAEHDYWRDKVVAWAELPDPYKK